MLENVREEQNIKCGTCIFYDLNDNCCHVKPQKIECAIDHWCGKYVNESNMVYFLSPVDVLKIEKLQSEMQIMGEYAEPAEDYGDNN